MKTPNGLQTGVAAPIVTMVVPVWNQLDFTKRLVESIRRYVHLPYKIVFIDNIVSIIIHNPGNPLIEADDGR